VLCDMTTLAFPHRSQDMRSDFGHFCAVPPLLAQVLVGNGSSWKMPLISLRTLAVNSWESFF